MRYYYNEWEDSVVLQGRTAVVQTSFLLCSRRLKLGRLVCQIFRQYPANCRHTLKNMLPERQRKMFVKLTPSFLIGNVTVIRLYGIIALMRSHAEENFHFLSRSELRVMSFIGKININIFACCDNMKIILVL